MRASALVQIQFQQNASTMRISILRCFFGDLEYVPLLGTRYRPGCALAITAIGQ